MRFEKLSITEEQRDKYFPPRQRGLLKRDDMHVFAMLEDEVIQAMAIVSIDNTFDGEYVIHDLYLNEGADHKYLTELIANVEEVCRSLGGYFMTCHLQGDIEQISLYSDILFENDYHFSDNGFRLFYAIEELISCRLMESANGIKNLSEHVIPYRMLSSGQRSKILERINQASDSNFSKTPDPEYGLAAFINGEIVAFLDARKLDEGTIYATPRYLCIHKYDSEARAMIMMYIIERAKQTMKGDAVLICETYNDTVHQQCFDWFGIPEKEDNVIEMIKNI